jgi:antagonist of KipI
LITVQRAPAYATVQDLGRKHFRSSGVPYAGAMDSIAMATINLLIGNARDSAGIEMALTGGAFTFDEATTFALGGAQCSAALGTKQLESYRAFRASAGETLQVENISAGRFLYIAFGGGIDTERVLGSRSTYVPGAFGGLNGSRLKAGDVLPIGSSRNDRAHQVADSLPVALRPTIGNPEIRFIPRPGEPVGEIAGRYTLSASSDRTGYRLEGFARAGGGSVTSEPVCMGTLQLPPGGEPIILMADAPTVGGYRVMGGVISADLGVLAQKLPGDSVELVPVTLEHARRELENLGEIETQIEEWCIK